MAARNITDAFDDCINRLASGQSIEQCLRAYPQYADTLRPMLQTSQAVHGLRLPQAQLLDDQQIVWQKMMQQGLSPKIVPIRRRRPPYQLLIAVVMLFLTMAMTWFVLSRPDLPPEEDDTIILTLTLVTLTPDVSATPTATVTMTETPTPTETISVTATLTSTPTYTSTMTPTPSVTMTPSPTSTADLVASATQVIPPTATFAPGCGAPLTEEDAIASVLNIYPNTTITSIRETDKYGDTLVWEVRTSHNILIDIDVACGTILVIEQSGGDQGSGNQNTNTNESSSGSSGGSGGGNDTINSNDNSGDGGDNANNNNDDDDSNDNSNDNNSGSGSNDNHEDDD